MDFGMYPPEINSGRMYTGPGSGPMLAAALAWDGLADELYTAASSYQSVVSGLTAGWSGPSSVAMAAGAASYATWLSATAAQTEETATKAKAAVAAYEAAFASTVPPPVIAANRSLLMTLVATNFFGQNTPAIATTEAHYAEMWAQDAAAMYGYAGSSAAATTLTPFKPPQQTTQPGGAASQATAVGQATGTSAGNVQSTLSNLAHALSAASTTPQSVAATAPAQATDPLTTVSNLLDIFLNGPADLAILFGNVPLDTLAGPVDIPWSILGTLSGLDVDNDFSALAGVEPWPGTGTMPPIDFPAKITNISPTAFSASSVSAGVGNANTIGAMSVPPGWAVEAPAVRPVALASSTSSVAASAVPAAAEEAAATVEMGSNSSFSEMALAGMVGRAMGGTPGTGGGWNGGNAAAGNRVAARAVRPATAGTRAATDGKREASHDKPRIVVTGIAARIRELAKLRDQGRMTEEEFTENKNRLLGR